VISIPRAPAGASAAGAEDEMTTTPIGVLYQHAEARPKQVAFIKENEVWT